MERRYEPQESTLDPEKKFYAFIRSLPLDAQEFISDLSSFMLEPDLYKKYSNDRKKMLGIKNELLWLGVKKNDIGKIFNYFHLPDQEPFAPKKK